MSESPEGTPVKPEAKRGHAAWKEQLGEIADRNAQARKRGTAERKVALSRFTEQRRASVRRENEQLHAINVKLTKARPRG